MMGNLFHNFIAVILTGFLGIILFLVVYWLVFGWRHEKRDKKRVRNYISLQQTRAPLSDSQFCEALELLIQEDAPYISQFRSAFAELIGADPLRILPTDDIYVFGISYDDDMEMFLRDRGLQKDHENYRYWFPLEHAAEFGQLIIETRKRNQNIEQETVAHFKDNV